MIKPRPEWADLAPYGVENRWVAPGKTPIQLDVNESLRPPSPMVAEAVAKAVAEAQLYPGAGAAALRAEIAKTHGLAPDAILCGAGSLELIGLLIRAFAGPGDAVLSTQYAYAYFRTATRIAGAEYLAAPETDMTVSVDALLAAVTPQTRIVCLANPGNPTGTVIPGTEIRRLRAGLRPDILLLLDQAYGEFAEGDPLFDLVERGDTVVMRTFSKAYGLAGIRLGWGVFPPEIAREIRKLQPPGPISALSLAAAQAAMADQAYMRETVAQTAQQRAHFAARLAQARLTPVPSQTNFILIRFPSAEAAQTADHALRAEGVMARGMGFYGLPDCLRVSIGTGPQMDLAADILAKLEV